MIVTFNCVLNVDNKWACFHYFSLICKICKTKQRFDSDFKSVTREEISWNKIESENKIKKNTETITPTTSMENIHLQTLWKHQIFTNIHSNTHTHSSTHRHPHTHARWWHYMNGCIYNSKNGQGLVFNC